MYSIVCGDQFVYQLSSPFLTMEDPRNVTISLALWAIHVHVPASTCLDNVGFVVLQDVQMSGFLFQHMRDLGNQGSVPFSKLW